MGEVSMTKKVDEQVREQLKIVLSNIENVVFATGDYSIRDIKFQTIPYDNLLELSLDIELIDNEPPEMSVEND